MFFCPPSTTFYFLSRPSAPSPSSSGERRQERRLSAAVAPPPPRPRLLSAYYPSSPFFGKGVSTISLKSYNFVVGTFDFCTSLIWLHLFLTYKLFDFRRFDSFENRFSHFLLQLAAEKEKLWIAVRGESKRVMNGLSQISSHIEAILRSSHCRARTCLYGAYYSYSWTRTISYKPRITALTQNSALTRFGGSRLYSGKAGKSSESAPPSRRKSKAEPAMEREKEKEKEAFYVVRKGDVVGVYRSLNDCQAQVGSSVRCLI